jgi:hypothetical protein
MWEAEIERIDVSGQPRENKKFERPPYQWKKVEHGGAHLPSQLWKEA